MWRQTRGRAGLDFRYHDLRHHFASALIAGGCSVKVVQKALGHASAKVTLDTYAHLWPDSDDLTRAAVQAAWCALGVSSAPPSDRKSAGQPP
jgi:integrase